MTGQPRVRILPPDIRACLLEVMIYHQRTDDPPLVGVCVCGWGELGLSHAEHVIDVFEESYAARLPTVER